MTEQSQSLNKVKDSLVANIFRCDFKKKNDSIYCLCLFLN